MAEGEILRMLWAAHIGDAVTHRRRTSNQSWYSLSPLAHAASLRRLSPSGQGCPSQISQTAMKCPCWANHWDVPVTQDTSGVLPDVMATAWLRLLPTAHVGPSLLLASHKKVWESLFAYGGEKLKVPCKIVTGLFHLSFRVLSSITMSFWGGRRQEDTLSWSCPCPGI